MKAKSVMVLGTASGVGKSVVAAGLCRLFSDWGYRVAPFKAQNMSNNSFVTEEGAEMGRAQVVQAECARVTPHADMNPVLLKPSQDQSSQVILQGKLWRELSARDYYAHREQIQQAIRTSYERLASEYEILVIEGAGSPAEVNLKEYDLANMRMAELADASCILVADIDRGGVFASLVGTLELLEPEEWERIVGLVINKFRGDPSLLGNGLDFIENRTGKKVWGVIPHDPELHIDEEDAATLQIAEPVPSPEGAKQSAVSVLDIAVILLPRISNFTDFQPLAREPGVRLRYVDRVSAFGEPDLLILPGTKATLADFGFLKQSGLAERILSFAAQGGKILGICGGHQMLGEKIRDEHAVESPQASEARALGFFRMDTDFHPEKIVRQVKQSVAIEIFGKKVQANVEAYEIHMGRTVFHETYPTFGEGGAIHPSGRIAGTYLHGLFDNPDFRRSFLDALWSNCRGAVSAPFAGRGNPAPTDFKEAQYTRLAALLARHLDLDLLRECLNLSLPSY